jgi:SAM-dependent methyltransferase
MKSFFDYAWDGKLVDKGMWFHNMPLPDGSRIMGANHDRNREQKMWEAFRRVGVNVKDKKVLDIGANDGFFSIGSMLAGAKSVTSINPLEMCIGHFPNRLLLANAEWNVELDIVVDNFLNLGEDKKYDVILYFGVLYHAEDVLGHFRKMTQLLSPGGQILIETPLTRINIEKPILEVASDRPERHTTVYRGQQYVKHVGAGSFFIPNFMALQEFAWTCEMDIEQLPDENIYTTALRDRKLFVMNDRRTN